MSYCEAQFKDADATPSKDVASTDTRIASASELGFEAEEGQADSDLEDENWDLLDDDDDICADFEEETKDFTKKLNAVRGSGGLASMKASKKGTVDKSVSIPAVPKSIQVRI